MKDKYRNFDELTRHERQGVDYAVTVIGRAHPVTVLAIHGGKIEPGTSKVAREVAGDIFNLYLFEGRGWDLHIASHRFDEPQAVALSATSRTCVTFHAFIETTPMVCIGGNNEKLKSILSERLLATGLTGQKSGNPLQRFQGASKMNIANRCRDGGAQIEISTALMDLLTHDPAKMNLFVGAVRAGLTEYIKPKHTPKGPTP